MKLIQAIHGKHHTVFHHNAIPPYPFGVMGRFGFARRPIVNLAPMRQELWWFRGGKA